MHPNVHSSSIYNSQDMETTYMSFDRWMDKEDVVQKKKEDVVHIYNGYYLAIKKN